MLIDFAGAEVNIGHGKIAYQSSTRYSGVASLAVDGNTNRDFRAGSCSHTDSELSPWWMVDLGHHCTISSVRVYNRDINRKCLLT